MGQLPLSSPEQGQAKGLHRGEGAGRGVGHRDFCCLFHTGTPYYKACLPQRCGTEKQGHRNR